MAVLLAWTAPGLAAAGDQGFGATTTGGAAGAVVRVTNLNDAGPGSFREAVSGGQRTVVFDVAGEIVLDDHVHVRGAHITIDGLSAPPPGITLLNRGLVIRGSEGAHDVIVRGLRVRNSTADNIQVAYGAYNVLIDHMSSQGAGDGNLDITFDSHDVTVAWSLLAEPASRKAMLIKYGVSRVTLHHNLFVRSPSRNPSAGIDDAGTPATDTTLDMRNNLVWDWDVGYGTLVHHGAWANVVANYYASPGSETKDQEEALIVCRPDCFGGDPTSVARGYVADNVSADPIGSDLNAQSTEPAPFPAPAVDTTDACVAAHQVLAAAGVRPLDALDQSYAAVVALPACGPAPTGTTLASSANPSRTGQAVTLTATVTAPDAGEPSGAVTFLDAGSPLATAPLSGGQATHTTSGLSVGNHALTAVYGGDGAFAGSESVPLTQVVDPGATTASLAGPGEPTVFGQAVTFTITVAADPPATGTPTGAVTVFDGSEALGSASLSGGVATYGTPALSVGEHAMTAVYGGSADFDPSASPPAAHTVAPGPTATALTSATSAGDLVTVTATVTAVAPAAGTPAGDVRFLDGTALLATVQLTAGKASYQLPRLAAGDHVITAEYAGEERFTGSTSAPLTVSVQPKGKKK